MSAIEVITNNFAIAPGGPAIKLASNNFNRAWIIFNCLSAAGTMVLSQTGDATLANVFDMLTSQGFVSMLRYDFPALVTGEIWTCGINGLTFATTLNVTEGILT